MSSNQSAIREAEDWYKDLVGNRSGGGELLNRWERLLDSDSYVAHLRNLRTFDEGFDPLPNFEDLEQFMRGVGHDLAAAEALPAGTLLRQIFWGRYVCRENYAALQATIIACLLVEPRPLTSVETELLYSTLDRMTRGGKAWTTVERVPAATGAFYRSLSRVRHPFKAEIFVPLEKILAALAKQRSDVELAGLESIAGGALQFLAAAVASKNGHRAVTVEDAIEAGFAYLQLFEVDLHDMVPVIREGRTGYELVG